jgi:ABC-2 type transport system ATP-binding protein
MAAIVVVDKLVKRYKGADVNAVDCVSFSVEPGELFALLGPNGAGKTTTISILTTTLTPTGGGVTIAGHDVVKEAAKVRGEVGIIFQRPSLDLNLTAEENVRLHTILYGLFPFRPSYGMMPRAYKERLDELSQVVDLGSEVFKPIKTFSGGMRRKLEVVRSLMHRPRVLFLDEPTTGLDPASRRSLWQYLTQVRASPADGRSVGGTTIVLTTHYLEEAEGADRICIVKGGRVVAYGTPGEIKARLVENYVLVDAADRPALLAELARLGLTYSGSGPLRIELNGLTVHGLLRSIETPLSLVKTHTPSLEEAYLDVIA